MKYILVTILLTIFMYGRGIDTHENYLTSNWCIDSKEVEEWTLVDKKVNYMFLQQRS